MLTHFGSARITAASDRQDQTTTDCVTVQNHCRPTLETTACSGYFWLVCMQVHKGDQPLLPTDSAASLGTLRNLMPCPFAAQITVSLNGRHVGEIASLGKTCTKFEPSRNVTPLQKTLPKHHCITTDACCGTFTMHFALQAQVPLDCVLGSQSDSSSSMDKQRNRSCGNTGSRTHQTAIEEQAKGTVTPTRLPHRSLRNDDRCGILLPRLFLLIWPHSSLLPVILQSSARYIHSPTRDLLRLVISPAPVELCRLLRNGKAAVSPASPKQRQ